MLIKCIMGLADRSAHASKFCSCVRSCNGGKMLFVSLIIVSRGTGYESLQVSKAITKARQFMLRVLRPCTIFGFTFAHYG